MSDVDLAIGNVMDSLVELHNDCTQKLRLITHFHPNNKKGIEVLQARRNAIQECITETDKIRKLYRARSLTDRHPNSTRTDAGSNPAERANVL